MCTNLYFEYNSSSNTLKRHRSAGEDQLSAAQMVVLTGKIYVPPTRKGSASA